MGRHINQTTVNCALTGDYSVSVKVLLFHSEVRAAVTDKHIEFLETSFVKQQCEAFPRCQLAFLVLGIDPFLASAHPGRGSALDQFLDVILLDAHILLL